MTTSTDPAILQTWMIDNEKDLADWAGDFAQKLAPPMVILLDGPMGSGKTTLIRYLMQAIHGEEASSPTFSLVNEYRSPGGMVYHFDLYRLEQPADLEEIGFDEYLQSGTMCFIEWPALGTSYYEEDLTSTIRIEVLPTNQRKIHWYKGIVL